MATPKRTSTVWEFFEEPVVVSGDGKAQKKVACKLCDLKLADGGGTTNLANHLKKKHPEQYKRCTSDSESSSKQASLRTMLQKCTPERSAAITNKIVGFIAKDLRPLSIVDGVGFHEMVSCLEPLFFVVLVIKNNKMNFIIIIMTNKNNKI